MQALFNAKYAVDQIAKEAKRYDQYVRAYPSQILAMKWDVCGYYGTTFSKSQRGLVSVLNTLLKEYGEYPRAQVEVYSGYFRRMNLDEAKQEFVKDAENHDKQNQQMALYYLKPLLMSGIKLPGIEPCLCDTGEDYCDRCVDGFYFITNPRTTKITNADWQLFDSKVTSFCDTEVTQYDKRQNFLFTQVDSVLATSAQIELQAIIDAHISSFVEKEKLNEELRRSQGQKQNKERIVDTLVYIGCTVDEAEAIFEKASAVDMDCE